MLHERTSIIKRIKRTCRNDGPPSAHPPRTAVSGGESLGVLRLTPRSPRAALRQGGLGVPRSAPRQRVLGRRGRGACPEDLAMQIRMRAPASYLGVGVG